MWFELERVLGELDLRDDAAGRRAYGERMRRRAAERGDLRRRCGARCPIILVKLRFRNGAPGEPSSGAQGRENSAEQGRFIRGSQQR